MRAAGGLARGRRRRRGLAGYFPPGAEERARRMLERMMVWSHGAARNERSDEMWQDLLKP
jgi:hypothetical protein